MRFGICTQISRAEMVSKLGYDYLEVSAAGLAEMTDDEFKAFCAENAAAPIHAETTNCLFPGTIRLTGEEADPHIIEEYIDSVFSRMERVGIKVAVFGSSGSRNVPDGFDRAKAWEQLTVVGRMLGDKAAEHGITVALEPLRNGETNIINTQLEGLKLVRDVDHPNFKLLCDYYHLMQENGTAEDVRVCGDSIVHIHIAKPDDRKAMYEGDGADYMTFFKALHDIGYDARISFEGGVDDYETELPRMLKVLNMAK